MDCNISMPNKRASHSAECWHKGSSIGFDVSNSTIVKNNDYANTLAFFASRSIEIKHP
jgi:hypothetical protein